MSRFDTQFNAIRTLGTDQVISKNLETTQKKGSFRCCIIRFFCGGADPDQYKMVDVAKNIHNLFWVQSNDFSLKLKGVAELEEFKAKLEMLKGKSATASSAQGSDASSELQKVIDKVDGIIAQKNISKKGREEGRPVSQGTTAAQQAAPTTSASKKDVFAQSLLAKQPKKKEEAARAATPAAPAPQQPASAPTPAKKSERARDPRAAALAATFHGHTRTTVARTETVAVPDAANVARFEALNTATQEDRALTKARADAPMRVVTASNGMKITKVYQPRKLGTVRQVVIKDTTETLDEGALLRQKREEILTKKKLK